MVSDPTGSSGFLLWTLMGILIGVVAGTLISLALRKSKSKKERRQASPPQINTPPSYPEPARKAGGGARRCRVCNSTYTDESLSFCVSDGSPLVPVNDNAATRDPAATLLYPERGNKDLPPTVASPADENLR